LLTAFVALVAEFLVVTLIEIFPDPSVATPVAFIAVASLVESFVITALFEEASKVIAMRMVIGGKAEPSTSFILANAAASSLTLATIENVAHTAYRIVHKNVVVNWVVFFIRPTFSVPLHICWGLTNGARIAVRRRTRQLLRRSMLMEVLPSVFLHGLWGFPFLLSYKSESAIANHMRHDVALAGRIQGVQHLVATLQARNGFAAELGKGAGGGTDPLGLVHLGDSLQKVIIHVATGQVVGGAPRGSERLQAVLQRLGRRGDEAPLGSHWELAVGRVGGPWTGK